MINPFDDREYFMAELMKALADMPKLVKKKREDYKKKQKFLKKTFGPAIAELEKELARSKKK
jgi:hypothetical protein